MAFNNKLDAIFPGTGVSLRSSTNVSLAIALSTTGAVANTIPSSGTLVPTFGVLAGKIRVRVYAGAGTSPTLAALAIKVSDGTNTVTVGAFNPAVAATLTTTTWVDVVFEFIIDFGASGNGGATGQMISNTTQRGATTVIVTTTLGGTSPTASMDVEIYPLA